MLPQERVKGAKNQRKKMPSELPKSTDRSRNPSTTTLSAPSDCVVLGVGLFLCVGVSIRRIAFKLGWGCDSDILIV